MDLYSDRAATISPDSIIEGKYRFLRTLGRGSMGSVVLAQDTTLRRQVALKFVNPGADSASTEIRRRFFRKEAANMAQIRHRNVAQVYSFGEHDGWPFFVMEHVSGEDLRSFIDRQGPLQVDVALGILRQVCDGLDAIHANGIVHRDIKLENIIIDESYRVCLVDFGVSELPGQEEQALLAGTPGYIAPEIVAGAAIQPEDRYLCDIYGLGVCTFELLTGELPVEVPQELRNFDQRNLPQFYRSLEKLYGAPSRLATSVRGELPPALDAILAQALSHEPRERYENAQAFFAALQGARDDTARIVQTQAGSRILIVEDDPGVRNMYGAIFDLSLPDVVVDQAADGLVALELARANNPQLIILDMTLPEVNGLELCALIRAEWSLRKTPILVISDELDEPTRAALANLGVANVLNKPIEPRRLAELAGDYLRRNPLEVAEQSCPTTKPSRRTS